MSSLAKVIAIVTLLNPVVGAATCQAGVPGSCVDDETNLMQMKSVMQRGADRDEDEAQAPAQTPPAPKSAEWLKKNEDTRVKFKKDSPSDAKDKKPSQPSPWKDFDELHKASTAAQEALSKLLNDAAKASGMEAHLPPAPGIKSTKRAMEKINKDYGGDFTKITDVCRGSLSTTSKDPCDMSMVVKAYNHLKPNVRFTKNKFAEPQNNGYADMNLLVEVATGKKKEVCEVQIHLLPMMEAKNGFEHKVYEKKQDLSRASKDMEKGAKKTTAKVGEGLLECVGFEVYRGIWKQCFGVDPPVKACIKK